MVVFLRIRSLCGFCFDLFSEFVIGWCEKSQPVLAGGIADETVWFLAGHLDLVDLAHQIGDLRRRLALAKVPANGGGLLRSRQTVGAGIRGHRLLPLVSNLWNRWPDMWPVCHSHKVFSLL